MVAVLALGLGGFRAGTVTAPGGAVSTMTAADHGAPVVTATPLPERPHLVDRRPDRGADGLAIALAVLLVLGAARGTGTGRRWGTAVDDATTSAGPPPATRAWHRRGPPAFLPA